MKNPEYYPDVMVGQRADGSVVYSRDLLAELSADNARLREAIRLQGEDADFYFLSDPEGRLFANLNDTFGYAVADAEPIPWDEFDAVIAAWKEDPTSLLLWAARKRGSNPAELAMDARVPPSTREALKLALAALDAKGTTR